MNILVINPGSTSLKIAVYHKYNELVNESINYKNNLNVTSDSITKQIDNYTKYILKVLDIKNIALSRIKIIVARGGLLRPVKGGIYKVNNRMLNDLVRGNMGDHPANYGGLIADKISKIVKGNAFVVDPVVVDEMDAVAKISGLPEIERKSIFHALNQKEVVRRLASELGKKVDQINVIVAHMGGGITVGCHRKGRVIDVNNGLDGDGPFTPERSGSLPVGDLLRICYSGMYSYQKMLHMIKGQGGIKAYLGINDLLTVEEKIRKGDKKAKLIYNAMAYQVAKEIGGLATTVNGEVDAIILTGGIAKSKIFNNLIKKRVKFIAPVYVFPGEYEMEAMVHAAMRIINKEEKANTY